MKKQPQPARTNIRHLEVASASQLKGEQFSSDSCATTPSLVFKIPPKLDHRFNIGDALSYLGIATTGSGALIATIGTVCAAFYSVPVTLPILSGMTIATLGIIIFKNGCDLSDYIIYEKPLKV